VGAARLILSVAVGLGTLTACGPTERHVSISVDRPAAMVDTAVDIRIGGLSPDAMVTLRAESRDYSGATWRSESRYRARGGTVDVARTAPDSGSYQGVDGMARSGR
jgi:acyl-CoA thioester hydrolase/bile acid acetyltransferase-like protein